MKTNYTKRKKAPVFTKKIGFRVLGLRKPNFKTKIIHFEKSHNAENCKRGLFDIFQHPFFCEISKKMKGNPLQSLKNFRKK